MKTASKKNGVHHDGATGKYFETVISDFLILKLCHRDFSRQSSLESKMLKILQIIKIWDSNELSWGCDKVIFVVMVKSNCCNIRKAYKIFFLAFDRFSIKHLRDLSKHPLKF